MQYRSENEYANSVSGKELERNYWRQKNGIFPKNIQELKNGLS
jgi:hypothetical protein